MDVQPLTRFREGDTKKAPAGPFVPPTVLATEWVLAFDQSVMATGWALLGAHRDGHLQIVSAGSFLLPAENYPSGHEGTLRRGMEVARRAEAVIVQQQAWFPTIVHEAPPVGGRMARPESSLVAALAVRIAAERRGLSVAVVQNQHSKKVLTGSANAEKKVWHQALGHYSILGKDLLTNEGRRDAACLALTYLIDLKEKDHG